MPFNLKKDNYGVLLLALAIAGGPYAFRLLKHLFKGNQSKHITKPTISKEDTLSKINLLENDLHQLRVSIDTEVPLEQRVSFKVLGYNLKCDKDVFITVGPVIGQVTTTTAIVLLEISLNVAITVHLIPNKFDFPRKTKTQTMPKDIPKAFLFEGLVPDTNYRVVVEGVNARDAQNRKGRVRTMRNDASSESDPKQPLRIVALSCNNPVEFRDQETNMWDKLAKQVLNDEIDVVLHLGDQVYGWKEFEDAQAILRYSGIPRGAESAFSNDPEIRYLCSRIKHRIRDIYRFTWNLPGTNVVLSHCSNLMTWSDNDIYNDFTLAKQAGADGIEPIMLYLAHQVYREYQRQLWDVNYEQDCTTDEFHYHKIGRTGIFMHDMRGNRISTRGEQRPSYPLLNDLQWGALTTAIADPTVKNLLICAEIPFVGNSPEDAKQGALNPKTPFLADHWPYNDKELVKLLEIIFKWKNEDKEGRDVIFIGGGLELTHITTSPMTNRVSPFFPTLTGNINERFSYTHVPLSDCRNYAYILSTVTSNKAQLEGKLIAGEPLSKL